AVVRVVPPASDWRRIRGNRMESVSAVEANLIGPRPKCLRQRELESFLRGESPGNGFPVEKSLPNVSSRPGTHVGLSTPRQNPPPGFVGYKQCVTAQIAGPAQGEAMICENFSFRVDQSAHRAGKLRIEAEIFQSGSKLWKHQADLEFRTCAATGIIQHSL